MTDCQLCGIEISHNSPPLCDECYDDSCLKCGVGGLYYMGDSEFKCSHGCQYDLSEYIARRIYTIILNESWREKLRVAGLRVEYIVQDFDAIKVHHQTPTTVPNSSVLATHYTKEPKKLVSEGVDPIPEDRESRFDGTFREGAAYSWPHNPTFANKHLSWDTMDYVIFEIPKEKVSVSSYRFLRYVSKDNSQYTIPMSKYKSELTFTPDQLYTIVAESNRPIPKKALF